MKTSPHREFLINETFNWFSKSSSRQTEYQKIYKCLNDDKVFQTVVTDI